MDITTAIRVKIANEIQKYAELKNFNSIVNINNTKENNIMGFLFLEKKTKILCVDGISIKFTATIDNDCLEELNIREYVFPTNQTLEYDINTGFISAGVRTVLSNYIENKPENRAAIQMGFVQTLNIWKSIENKYEENLTKIKEVLKNEKCKDYTK